MIEQILEERGNRYGEFAEHARITQEIKDTLYSGSSWELCTDSQREALEMIAHKMGRIVNGDPTYIDSFLDICGYSQLVVDELTEDEQSEDEEDDDIDWQSLAEYTKDSLQDVVTGSDKFANDIVNLITEVTGEMRVEEPEDETITEIEINGIRVLISGQELVKLEALKIAEVNEANEANEANEDIEREHEYQTYMDFTKHMESLRMEER